MGDQPISKLTASLDELSLKKQLPLRQQAQKPMLKYNNSVIKPVQLFNHADLVSIRSNAEAARNAYSSLSNASSSSSMNTPFRSAAKPPTPPTKAAPELGAVYSNSQAHVSSSKSPSKGHSNPYARPLSAKDIVNDIQNQKIKKYTSQIQTGTGGPNDPNANPGTPTFSFQLNAFMRPQSAVKKDSKSLQQRNSAKATKTVDEKGGKTDNKSEAAKAVNTKRAIPPTKLEREVDLSEVVASPNHSTVLTLKKNQFGPAKRDNNSLAAAKGDNGSISNSSSSASLGSIVDPSRVSSSSQTTVEVKSVPKGLNQTDSSTNTTTNPLLFAKPVSSLPRPGSQAPRSNSSTPDSVQKVRNLNYTPTKPYSEVSDPTPQTNSSTLSKKPPISATTKTIQTTETSVNKGTTYMAPSNIGKVYDKHNSNISVRSNASNSSTVYYSKESKEEMVIHEQRPPVVGAAAQLGKGLEKDGVGSATTLASDIEEEYEESENCTPSGERQPGDGEASLVDEDDYEDDDDEDDEAIDGLDDDCVGGTDDESDGYSFTSSLSRRSSSAHIRGFKSRPVSGASTDLTSYSRPATASPKPAKPAFIQSHFSSIPPVVNFIAEGEKVEQLPWEIRKFLKWRLSPITPNVVKGTLARVGFRITKRNHDWLGCWGKHMKSPGFKALREYQKVNGPSHEKTNNLGFRPSPTQTRLYSHRRWLEPGNFRFEKKRNFTIPVAKTKLNHFPGSFQIGRKDRLWRNLSKMQVHFGKKEFGFFPQTFCLPYDTKLLKRAWEDGGTKQKWIIKPPASARGIGIKVINKFTQIPRRRPVIVQKYLGRPYLINDSKFDLRIYVYISSYDPLRLYVFEDGLARFASMKYSSSMKNLNNKFIHLTNYSVNKKNSEYKANGDDAVCQGHKWSLKALWNFMKRQGINTNAVWDSMKDLIIKTVICADGPVNSLIKANCKSRYTVHELFGFDILLDEHLKPWLLEVNISPSLHSNSQLDINIKGHMIRDLFNIAGFRVPDKHDITHNAATSGPSDVSMYVPPNDYCLDKRLFAQQLSPDERAKHAYYSQRHQDEQVMQSILDTLTPDDIRMLTESIDEDGRKGGFQRVFPTPSTHKYLKYFETARYYNLLLDQWVQRYNRMEQRGISMLESFCDEGIHLEMNTENPNHQWNPPNATCHSFREPRLLSAPVSKHKEDVSLKARLYKRPVRPPPNRTLSQPPSRTLSQSSSVSSINNLVLSPIPIQNNTPRGKAINPRYFTPILNAVEDTYQRECKSPNFFKSR